MNHFTNALLIMENVINTFRKLFILKQNKLQFHQHIFYFLYNFSTVRHLLTMGIDTEFLFNSPHRCQPWIQTEWASASVPPCFWHDLQTGQLCWTVLISENFDLMTSIADMTSFPNTVLITSDQIFVRIYSIPAYVLDNGKVCLCRKRNHNIAPYITLLEKLFCTPVQFMYLGLTYIIYHYLFYCFYFLYVNHHPTGALILLTLCVMR